jgi:trehalose 6-phosphate synthase/phosphatase
MGKLVTVTNRLPFSLTRRGGSLNLEASAGGVATGLGSFYRRRRSVWLGWPGIPAQKVSLEEERHIRNILEMKDCRPIFLSQSEVDNYYHGFANKTIWPLFHYFPTYAIYNKNYWAAYQRVNEKFCGEALKIIKPGDQIWIHDYHLMLLPALLRERLPGAAIGFFLHIPFPSFEIFRLLPWREEILRGFLGADLVGFHTYNYAHYFLSSVRHLLHYDHLNWLVKTDNRAIRVEAFPMGIDYEHFHSAINDPEIQREIDRIRKKSDGRKIILTVDRLDYTKGIPQRLEAFELFLEKNPEFREKVILIMISVPSRTAVETYSRLKSQVDELVGRINGKYGSIGWVPIWYLYRFLPFKNLVAFYNLADVALVTPQRDGMNLIAKEYVATKTDGRGVLVLSEMAGSAKELGDALLVNPNNKEEVSAALRVALMMPEPEQKERLDILQKRLERFTVLRWADDFMTELEKIKRAQRELEERKLDAGMIKKMIDEYRGAGKALLLLDYDGTMAPFVERPERADPDRELKRLLGRLARRENNEVVVISGRSRQTLEDWLGGLRVSLIAEHGAWIREQGRPWGLLEPAHNDWKTEVKGILIQYADRTPGAFVEEKSFSLVLHYRRVDPEIVPIRITEAKEDLLDIASQLGLEVIEGNKVIEVRIPGINKGRAALQFVTRTAWDFILAVGDDRTDEDMFAVLPETAYSIKVGLGPSLAKFNLSGVAGVRELLKKFARRGHAHSG